MAFSADGNVVAVACGSVNSASEVQVRSLVLPGPPVWLKGHRGGVRALAFSPEELTLATAGEDAAVKLWDVAPIKRRVASQTHSRAVLSVAISRDGQLAATASMDQTVKLWDLATRSERASLEGHVEFVNCLAYSLDGKRLATGSHDGMVKLWDPASGQELGTLRGPSSINALAFSPDGKALAAASSSWYQGEEVILWRVAESAGRDSDGLDNRR